MICFDLLEINKINECIQYRYIIVFAPITVLPTIDYRVQYINYQQLFCT